MFKFRLNHRAETAVSASKQESALLTSTTVDRGYLPGRGLLCSLVVHVVVCFGLLSLSTSGSLERRRPAMRVTMINLKDPNYRLYLPILGGGEPGAALSGGSSERVPGCRRSRLQLPRGRSRFCRTSETHKSYSDCASAGAQRSARPAAAAIAAEHRGPIRGRSRSPAAPRDTDAGGRDAVGAATARTRSGANHRGTETGAAERRPKRDGCGGQATRDSRDSFKGCPAGSCSSECPVPAEAASSDSSKKAEPLLALTPMPAPLQEPVNIPSGEARARFAISPEPNLGPPEGEPGSKFETVPSAAPNRVGAATAGASADKEKDSPNGGGGVINSAGAGVRSAPGRGAGSTSGGGAGNTRTPFPGSPSWGEL